MAAPRPRRAASRSTSRSSDADAAWNRAIEAGATEKMPLADQFWGDRYGQVEDPFGFTWSIGAPLAVPTQD